MPQLSSGCRNYSNCSAKSRTRQDQALSAGRLDSTVARPVVRIRPPRQTETGIYRKLRGDKDSLDFTLGAVVSKYLLWRLDGVRIHN